MQGCLHTVLDVIDLMPNHFAGVVAGCTPELIEMMQVGPSLKSGSARLTIVNFL
jgi:hypothetical protein